MRTSSRRARCRRKRERSRVRNESPRATPTARHFCIALALLRMTRRPWRSATVAALFAWHPAHVESVAWIAERKDVLSGFFFFLTLVTYARHAEQPSVRRFGFVALFFALGLMAKPMLVTLPFVLLLLDYWPLERLRAPAQLRHLAVEKIPLFALSAASCLVTFIVQKSCGAVMPLEYVPIYERLGNAVISCARYLGILLWPARLIVPYRASLDLDALAISLAALALTIAVVKFGARRKFLPVGWFWYLGTLIPVIGIVQVGRQA